MNKGKRTPVIMTFLLMFASLAGCAGLEKTAPPLTMKGSTQVLRPGDIVDTRTGERITFQTLVERLSDARVIYAGETHTSIEDHQIQQQILQGLYDRNPHLILAMEMFPRGKQPVLNRYSSKQIGEQKLLAEAEWSKVWGYPFQLYRGLLTWARERHLKIVGLNAPPEVVRKIGRNGLSSLTPQERSKIARDINLNDVAHRAYVQEQYQQHIKDNIRGFQSFYEAQLAWEETMAETLAQTLSSAEDGTQIVVLIGNGHIVRNFGVPRRTYDRIERAYKTVVPIPADYPNRVIDPGIADYVWITKESTRFHHRGFLGIMVTPATTEKGLEIKGVVPDSPAAEAGLKKGDILYAFDGKPTNSVEDIHKATADGTGDVHQLSLRRGGKEIKVNVKLSR